MFQSIARGGALSFGVRIIGLALGFASHVMLSRALGASVYGLFAVAQAWALLLVTPSKFGVDQASLRFASVYLSDGKIALFWRFVRFATITTLIASAVTVAVAVGIELLIPDFFGVPEGSAVVWMLASVPVLAMLGVYSIFLRAGRLVVASQFYEQVLRSVVLCLLLAPFLLAAIPLSGSNALLLAFLSAAIALGALLLHFYLRYRSLPVDPADPLDHPKWLQVSWPLLLMSVIQQILTQSGVIMLGWFSTPDQAGYFSAAARLSSFVTFGLVAVSVVTGPMIAAAHARGERAALSRIAHLNARISLAGAVLVIGVLALTGELLLGIFGPSFSEAYPALLILLVGAFVNAFTGSAGYLMTMTGRQQPALVIIGVSAVISIVVGILLIPRYGVSGAAIAAALAVICTNIWMTIYVRRTLGIDATAAGRPVRLKQRGGEGLG